MKDVEDKIISQESQTLYMQEKREVNLYLKSAEGPFLWKPGEAFVRLSSGTEMETEKTSSFQIFFFSDQFSYQQGEMANTVTHNTPLIVFVY